MSAENSEVSPPASVAVAETFVSPLGSCWAKFAVKLTFPAAVGRDCRLAQERLSLAVPGGIAGIGEKLKSEGRVRRTIERTGDDRVVRTGGKACEHREVLQVVRTAVRPARSVRGHARRCEIDAEAAVAEDRVRQDRIARSRVDEHARARVAGDDVGLAGVCAANRVARGIHENAVAVVGDRGGLGGVQADVVAFNQNGGRSEVGVDEIEAVAQITADRIPGTVPVPPIVTFIAPEMLTPDERLKVEPTPWESRPMMFPWTRIFESAERSAGDQGPVTGIAGDDVAGARGRSADRQSAAVVDLDPRV